MRSTTAPVAEDEPEIDVSEAAQIGKVSGNTIRRAADRGLLPVRRLPSGVRRFKRSDVERVFGLTPSAR
jgi:DNA-binding transcriptional MerR regulator